MVDDDLIPAGRVFAAVRPPPEVVAALDERLAALPIPGRPVPPPNWHVTLRFVGHVEEVAYQRWLAELDSADLPSPFRLSLSKLGAFPRPARATVLWVGVEGDGRLERLAEAVDEAADGAGLGREERPFWPHLTISRVRPPADVRGLMSEDHAWELPFRVGEFHVMAAQGRRYRIYETFSL
ncbi:MAG: RNA 2',3'-cyclic phosphodiesterase [Actinomycetota bacterium]